MRALHRRAALARALFVVGCACCVAASFTGSRVADALTLVALAALVCAHLVAPTVDEVLVAHARVELALASLPAKGRA